MQEPYRWSGTVFLDHSVATASKMLAHVHTILETTPGAS